MEPAATFPNLGLPDDWCVRGSGLRGMPGRDCFCERLRCCRARAHDRGCCLAHCQHVTGFSVLPCFLEVVIVAFQRA